MKRKLTLLLAVLMLVSLFAGCGGTKTAETPATAAPVQSAKPAAETTPAPVKESSAPAPAANTPVEETPGEETGPYNLAKGKYEVDERGVPLTKYTYEMPLTTSDEVFTFWTGALLPDQIDEDYEGMPFPTLLRETTGVHIEYILISSASRAQNCSVLVASDDLPDLLGNYNYYYPGTMQESIDDGFSVNLFDYKDYIPNYMYCIYDHEEDLSVRATLMANDHTIYYFKCINDVLKTTWGGCVRGDWVQDLGLTIDDIITFDDLHNLLLAFKSQLGCEYPFLLMSNLDPHTYWSGFETIGNYNATVAPAYVKDGKVQFACSGANDFNYMGTLNAWYNDGLISPNWTARSNNLSLVSEFVNGQIGLCSMVPSEQYGYVDHTIDPDACWKAIHKPLCYEGQVFHLGNVASWLNYGTYTISTKCENIPLLATYIDWMYSDEGAIVNNWGVEGYTFYFDENGKRMLTDFIVNHPSGSGWALLQFTMNNVYEGGILIGARNVAKPGGELDDEFVATWDDPKFYRYDGTMQWPSAIQFDAEDSSRLAAIGSDIQTFIAENYLMFVDNSRSMSDWDKYVDELTGMPGWDEALEIYQRNYDDFMSRF